MAGTPSGRADNAPLVPLESSHNALITLPSAAPQIKQPLKFV
jgi:hypothetical protein